MLEDHGHHYADRIREKFGDAVSGIILDCTDTQEDGDPDKKAPWDERKLRYIQHLETVDERTALVAACDKLHNLGAIVADVRDSGLEYLSRFNASPEDQIWYYESTLKALGKRIPQRLRLELEKLLAELRTLLQTNPS